MTRGKVLERRRCQDYNVTKNGFVAAVKCEGAQKNATDEKPLIFHRQ